MINKVKWNNHASLGNLELDFLKDDGSAYSTIVLAGENGTGKTTILETLSSFLAGESMLPFGYIDYHADGGDFHITPSNDPSTVESNGFHDRLNRQTGAQKQVMSGRLYDPDSYQNDPHDLRAYGHVYSKARSGFRTERVQAITTQQLDIDKHEPDEEDDFTRIKQLLVDIASQDASEWMRRSSEGGISDSVFEEFEQASKTHRFRSAFNDFFDSLEYVRVDNEDPDEKRVIFQKHGREIGIDDLSTGEKQIVFRGAHLLRNLNSVMDGIVLIDEPELSMHPMWQRKILDYYRQLFTYGEKQGVQMIVATHSEYVVRAALEDRSDALVMVLTDDNGTIRSRRITTPGVLPKITAAETNYLAFNIASIDYHIELYGYLQSKTNSSNVKQCDEYIRNASPYMTSKHEKKDNYKNWTYETLPTYIRNAIDHPESGRKYTDSQLQTSIELLINICKELA